MKTSPYFLTIGRDIKKMDASKKIFLSFFAIILSLLVIFVTSYSTPTTQTEVRTKASGLSTNAVSLILAPNEATHKVGEVFDIQIYLNTFGVETSAVGTKLFFDPNILEALQITPGAIFGYYPNSSFNQSEGSISLSGVSFDPANSKPGLPFLGTGLFGTVRFRAKAPSTTTSVRFDFNPNGGSKDTGVIDIKSLTNVLQRADGAEFTIEP